MPAVPRVWVTPPQPLARFETPPSPEGGRNGDAALDELRELMLEMRTDMRELRGSLEDLRRELRSFSGEPRSSNLR